MTNIPQDGRIDIDTVLLVLSEGSAEEAHCKTLRMNPATRLEFDIMDKLLMKSFE